MKKTAYNILWADDECDSLREDKLTRMYFDKRSIHVLSFIRTSEELKAALERFYDKVDAVIVDGNFSRTGILAESDNNLDITGLVHTVSFIDTFNQKRDIPFFLYTGKKTRIQEACNNLNLLSYFLDLNRIIQKGKVKKLCDAIVEAVENIRSVEHNVTKKYSDVLEMAAHIDINPDKYNESVRDLLYRFLLDEAKDTKYDKAELMFTSLRIIMEQIADNCKSLRFVPEPLNKDRSQYSLNYFARYWSYKDEKYKKVLDFVPADDTIMPPALSTLIKPIVDILQDGSHGLEELPLGVNDYVATSQTPYLFRLCLHFVLNMIQWYHDVKRQERPKYYIRNPYMLIRKEWDSRHNKHVYRYKDFWFAKDVTPTDHEIGRDIEILRYDKKTILDFRFKD